MIVLTSSMQLQDMKRKDSVSVIDFSGAGQHSEELVSVMYELSECTGLKKLFLSRCGVTDDQASALAKHVSNCGRLESIDLAHNNFGANGLESIVGVLGSFPQLHSIDVSYNAVGAQGVQLLARKLPELGHVHTIKLSSCRVGVEGVKALAEALPQLPELHTLELDGNELGCAGVLALAGFVTRCDKLRHLSLDSNNIDEKGAKVIADFLPFCWAMEVLDLWHNDVGEQGAEAIVNVLPLCGKLQSLGLDTVKFRRTIDEAMDPLNRVVASRKARLRRVQQERDAAEKETRETLAKVEQVKKDHARLVTEASKREQTVQRIVKECKGDLAGIPLETLTNTLCQLVKGSENIPEALKAFLLEVDGCVDIVEAATEKRALLQQHTANYEAAKAARIEFVKSLPSAPVADAKKKLNAMTDKGKTLEEVSQGASSLSMSYVLRPVWEFVQKERKAEAEMAEARLRSEIHDTLAEHPVQGPAALIAAAYAVALRYVSGKLQGGEGGNAGA